MRTRLLKLGFLLLLPAVVLASKSVSEIEREYPIAFREIRAKWGEPITVLGSGGQGHVILVKGKDQSYAIKIDTHDELIHEMMAREVALLKKLQPKEGEEPVVPKFVHFDDVRGFLVMERVAGYSLQLLLASDEGKDEDKKLFGLKNEARINKLHVMIRKAIETIHRKGIIHADIKPANIMVDITPAGEIKEVRIVDFGIAGNTLETVRGSTADYAHPEIIRSYLTGRTPKYDPAFDYYALELIRDQLRLGSSSPRSNVTFLKEAAERARNMANELEGPATGVVELKPIEITPEMLNPRRSMSDSERIRGGYSVVVSPSEIARIVAEHQCRNNLSKLAKPAAK